MTLPFGIDISRWQYGTDITTQKPDFKIIRSKATFIGIRAGMSWGYTDPTFRNSWMETEGMYRIAYHVVYAGEDPIRQMKHFLSIVKPGPKDLLALDLEVDHGYSMARYTDTVVKCIDYLRQETGRLPIIYSRALWINLHIDVSKLPADIPWWLAYYRKTNPTGFTPEADPPPLLPIGIKTWLIHQTGDKVSGKEYGVKSYTVDTNRFNGTPQDLALFFAPTAIPEDPKPDPKPPVDEPIYKAKVITTPPNRLNVRKHPYGDVIDKIHSGTIVDVMQDRDSWLRIGTDRWVLSLWLEKLQALPPTPDMEGLFQMNLWSQKDPRWANHRMGDTYITMAQEGCLVTNTSSYMAFLGIDTDPLRYNQLLTARFGYQYDEKNKRPTNKMYWKMPEKLWPGKVAMAEYSWFNYGVGWESFAERIIQSGRPAMAQVDAVPGGSMQQHWVSLLGKLNNIWYCYDPLYGLVSALSARYNGVYRIAAYVRR